MIQDNCSNCKHRGDNNICTAHNIITPDDAWCIGYWPVEERSESKHCMEVAKEFYKGLKAGLEADLEEE